MAQHFIYVDKDTVDSKQLFQGDVLEKDARLLEILKEYHPHYAYQENYHYFLVLTQSCDIHRRGDSPPTSAYINIAAVRPLEDAVWQIAKKYQEWWQIPTHTLSSTDFNKLVNVTASLLDNNVPNYFYLHEDADLGITVRSCAFLSLSIALRIEHYETCLKAKIAQLKNEFQAKLGWLVGSMYSKVGTEEWNDHNDTDVYKEAANILKDQFAQVESKRIDKCLRELRKTRSIEKYAPSDIVDYISRYQVPSNSNVFREQAINEIRRTLEHYDMPNKDKVIKKLVASLVSNPVISRLLQ